MLQRGPALIGKKKKKKNILNESILYIILLVITFVDQHLPAFS